MNRNGGFAVWITGLPSSGKSTIAAALAQRLRGLGIIAVTLESDAVRKILTPEPTYTTEERERFYRQFAEFGALIVRSGVPVILDATANRRAYRDHARGIIPRFLEVAVTTPLEVCRERDAKGLYAAAAAGLTTAVPGVQTAYEAPAAPDVALDGRSPAQENADRIIEALARNALVEHRSS